MSKRVITIVALLLLSSPAATAQTQAFHPTQPAGGGQQIVASFDRLTLAIETLTQKVDAQSAQIQQLNGTVAILKIGEDAAAKQVAAQNTEIQQLSSTVALLQIADNALAKQSTSANQAVSANANGPGNAQLEASLDELKKAVAAVDNTGGINNGILRDIQGRQAYTCYWQSEAVALDHPSNFPGAPNNTQMCSGTAYAPALWSPGIPFKPILPH